MLTMLQRLFWRQASFEASLSTVMTPAETLPSVRYTTFVTSGLVTIADSGPFHCYVVVEVGNIVVGTPIGLNENFTLPIGDTSFTFGANLSITPMPTPIQTYDFFGSYVIEGETM